MQDTPSKNKGIALSSSMPNNGKKPIIGSGKPMMSHHFDEDDGAMEDIETDDVAETEVFAAERDYNEDDDDDEIEIQPVSANKKGASSSSQTPAIGNATAAMHGYLKQLRAHLHSICDDRSKLSTTEKYAQASSKSSMHQVEEFLTKQFQPFISVSADTGGKPAKGKGGGSDNVKFSDFSK